MFGRHPLDSREGIVHTVQAMIDQSLRSVKTGETNKNTAMAQSYGSGGIASDSTTAFESLWSSYDESVENGNVGWLRGYGLPTPMSVVVGGGETIADSMFSFDVPNGVFNLGNSSTLGAELRIYESGGGGYFGFIASAASNNRLFTWPNDWPVSTKFLQVSSGGIISYASGSGGGAVVFTDLTDVPASYAAAALDLVRVNAAATGLEFVENFWTRGGGGKIEFQTINDMMELNNSSNNNTININNSATTGGYDCINISYASTAGRGLKSTANHTTGQTRAIEGWCSSNHNDSYAGFFANVSYNDHSSIFATGGIDLEFAGGNVTPASNRTSLYCDGSDGRLYYILPTGAIYGPLDAMGGGSTTFIGLLDVPVSFTGASLQAVRVNAGETALEFYTPASSNGWTRTGTDLIPTTADDDLLLHDGSTIGWGNGNPGTLDTWFGRGAAGRIDVGDNTTSYLLRVWGGASTSYTQMSDKFSGIATNSTDVLFRALISTDSNNRWQSTAAGVFNWGAGGGSAVDTQLSRTAAHFLSMGSGDTFESGTFSVTNGGFIQTTQGVGDKFYLRAYATTGAAWQNLISLTNGALLAVLDFPQGATYNGAYIYHVGGTPVALTDGGTGQTTAPAAINALGAAPASNPFHPFMDKLPGAAGAATSNTTYCMYLGRAPKTFTSVQIAWLNGTAATGGITWAEIGLCSGAIPAVGTNPVLTLVAFADVSAVVGTTGAKNTTVAASFTAGDHMWMVWGCQSGTNVMRPRGTIADEENAGLQAKATTTRPSTMGASKTFVVDTAMNGFYGYFYPN